MSGRTRLSWVTALTVTTLLLGAGTLNALADGHGGRGQGGGSGKVEHQQAKKFAQAFLKGQPRKATIATTLLALQAGVWGVRVHDVRGNVDAIKVWQATRAAR